MPASLVLMLSPPRNMPHHYDQFNRQPHVRSSDAAFRLSPARLLYRQRLANIREIEIRRRRTAAPMPPQEWCRKQRERRFISSVRPIPRHRETVFQFTRPRRS